MYRFLIIIERGSRNYSAYAPDLPGCIATGKTLEDVKGNMREAIAMHVQGMVEDQEPIPTPQTTADYLDILLPNPAAWLTSHLIFQEIKLLDPNHPDIASTLNSLALLYASQGDYEQAIPLLERALAIKEKTPGSNHPSTKIVRGNFATLLENMKKQEKKWCWERS